MVNSMPDESSSLKIDDLLSDPENVKKLEALLKDWIL